MKRRTDFLQLECDAPEAVDPSHSPVNTDSDRSWDTEPNFNLNFNLSSASNPRPIKETSKMESWSKKEDKSKRGGKTGNKGALAVDGLTVLLRAEKKKSKIPTISSLQTAQTSMKNKGCQQLRSPNIEHPSTPKIEIYGKTAISSRPNSVEVNHSQKPTEKVQTETTLRGSAKPIPELMPELRTNSANITPNLKMQANRKDGDVNEIDLETSFETLQLPKSQNSGHQKGVKSGISPHMTKRTPAMMDKTKKNDQKAECDYKTEGIFINPGTSEEEKMESTLLGTKTAKGASLSPKPSIQAKTGTRNSNVSGSKENLQGKYLKAVSGPKAAVQSSTSPKATKESKDSVDSKSSSGSRSQSGSRDALDSKSRMKKSPQNSEKISASKTTNSKNNQGSKSLQKSKASFDPKLITSSGSESKTGVTHTASLATLPTSSLDVDLLGCVSISPISSGSIKTANSAVELRLSPESLFDPSRSELVQCGSKSTLIGLSSLSQSPGSSTGHSASTSTGLNKENQKSPSYSPGILAPLTSSSPKTRPVMTLKTLEGFTHTSEASAVISRDAGSSSQNTCLTRGLTSDSITKLDNTAVVKEHLQSRENKVQTQKSIEVSQEDKNNGKECPSGDNGRELVLPARKKDSSRDTNILSSSRAPNVGEQKQKMQVHGKKNEENSSSLLHPISSLSTHVSTKKKFKVTAAKSELAQRLHKHPGEQKEVGIQVDVEVVERSASTSPSLQRGPPTSSLIGSCSCQSSLSYLPPLKHVCQIEIELCSQSLLPSPVPDKASSLPACLRTYSFQQNPALMSDLGQAPNPDVSTESIWEYENEDEKNPQANKAKQDGFKGQMEKPPEVLWDKQGMTWEVYGASVDLESLGTAIQSHLEMKIREKERHIRILRKSICSNNSFSRCKSKKRRRRFLGCCVKASKVSD